MELVLITLCTIQKYFSPVVPKLWIGSPSKSQDKFRDIWEVIRKREEKKTSFFGLFSNLFRFFGEILDNFNSLGLEQLDETI